MEELKAEDRMMIAMRDNGESWGKINEMWAAATGAAPGGKSTLPNRYARIKANLTQISEEHMEYLVEAHKKVHEQFEQEKWGRIKTVMEANEGVASSGYTVSSSPSPSNMQTYKTRLLRSRSTSRRLPTLLQLRLLLLPTKALPLLTAPTMPIAVVANLLSP